MAEPAAVASAVARALLPPAAEDPPPSWLRPAQLTAFRRALAAIRRYGGALLAEPAGTGKTWIALAVASRLGAEAAAVVPAAVTDQWRRVARRAGVALTVTTHEAWSRGSRLLGPGLVIVDECHGFRTPGLRRTRHLAGALIGRSGLLLSATPVVNRTGDLLGPLALFLRDDALAPAGIASLGGTLATGDPPQSLAEIVVAGTTTYPDRPALAERTITPPGTGLRRLVRDLDALVLSPRPSVAGLIRGTLLAALASSPAALDATLERYRLLLLQSRDAARAGRRPLRNGIRALLGDALDQLVLWELLGGEADGDPGLVDEVPAIDLLLARLRRNLRRGDPKVRRLQSLLADGKPTLVFSGLRATVDHLRRHLTPTGRIAWCTGRSAGIGRTRVRRSAVLAWFRPSAPGPLALAPSVLVTTDVAAEGMDLHGAVRVVHYDLPWTPSRLDQRAGRVRRIGSSHAEVEVVRFLPPPLLAVRLRVLDALARKAGLPGRLGVGEQPDENWTWRARMAAVARDAVAPGCIASARASAPGMLLAFRAGPGGDGPTQVWLRDAGGRWRADPGSIEAALAAALASPALPEPTPAERARALRQASTLIARRLREVAGAVWGLRAPSPLARAAIARIRTLAARCVRRRDTAGLARADAALAFLRRGHTVGEGMLVERLALCAEDELPGALGMLPSAPPIPRPVRATLLGMILFRRG